MGLRRVGLSISIYMGFCAVVYSSSAVAQCAPGKEVPGEYLVRVAESIVEKNQGFSQKISTSTVQSFFETFSKVKTILKQKTGSAYNLQSKTSENPIPTLLHIVDKDVLPEDILNYPGVLSVEPNCYIEPMAVPNDPDYSQQWAHQVMQSEDAWKINTGSQSIIVAVSDTGVDYNHEDLKDQMWTNSAELNGVDGVDDDNNGYIDDIYGWDFGDEDNDPIPGGMASSGHGTHVAGIIGARGNNNTGITGMNWNIKLMAVKGFFDNEDGTTSAALLSTVEYAVNNGAHVINCSWGSNSKPTQADRDVFQYAKDKGVVTVVAAGNSYKNAKNFSPAALSNTITVGSSNSADELSGFSNYGSRIDVLAPGGDTSRLGGRDETILSTLPGNSYEGLIGTSMAAPYVAGLAGLILSINSKLTVREVGKILRDSAETVTVTVPMDSSIPAREYLRVNAGQAALMAKASLPDIGGGTCDPSTDESCSSSGSRDLSSSFEKKNALARLRFRLRLLLRLESDIFNVRCSCFNRIT